MKKAKNQNVTVLSHTHTHPHTHTHKMCRVTKARQCTSLSVVKSWDHAPVILFGDACLGIA